jgi:broad specificity phosphatase PhoE
MGVDLWLMRHGETAWSVSGAHTSWTDIPLTEQGRARGVTLGKYLHRKDFARIYVSPMARARETCSLAGFGGQAIVEPNLMEWNYGEAEGKTTAELRKQYNDPEWSVWNRTLVGGETVEHVGERADAVIARTLVGLADHASVGLFAHAHILRILAARWIGLEARGGQNFLLGTGTVSVLGWEREARVVTRWNCGLDD